MPLGILTDFDLSHLVMLPSQLAKLFSASCLLLYLGVLAAFHCTLTGANVSFSIINNICQCQAIRSYQFLFLYSVVLSLEQGKTLCCLCLARSYSKK